MIAAMTRYILPLALLIATASVAHEGVKNPAVMARMDSMKALAKETKLLNQMAKGSVPFAKAKAEMAVERAQQEASKVIPLFQNAEHDLKSEAAMAIWTSFPDFAQRASNFSQVTQALDPSSQETLAASIGAFNAECKNCHASYRISK